MKLRFLLLFLLLNQLAFGQSFGVKDLKFGSYGIACSKMILFDKQYTYKAYGYEGAKPVFVKVWYPIKTKKQNSMYLSDVLEYPAHKDLEVVIQEASKRDKEIFIRDFISEHYESGEENTYGNISFDSVYSLLMHHKTLGNAGLIPVNSKYPVIVYHHGSQSNAAENFLMAEYFASHGFIFVSANFHLPYPDVAYGLKPFNQLVKGEEEANVKMVYNFAKSLSSSTKIFYIGHSLGAQMGLRTFANDSSLARMISLETTLEFQSDTNKIKDYWAEVYQKVKIENAHYPFPILFCASSKEKKPFPFFESLNAKSKQYVYSPESFDHDAYLAYYYLRMFLPKSIVQNDRSVMENGWKEYVRILEEMKAFLLAE